MAYERTWQFMAVQPPYTPASNLNNSPHALWTLKRMLTGEADASITQGLWSVYGSSDGSTAGMDAVDRWGSPFALPTFKTASSGQPMAWMVLTRSIGGLTVYLTLQGAVASGSGYETLMPINLTVTAPTGGSATALPTMSNTLGNIGNTFSGLNYNADTTNARRYYGGVTSLGDFWFAKTINGEIEHWAMVVAPVGCKTNDQYPIWVRGGTAFGAAFGVPFGSNALYANQSYDVGKFYNGSAGYSFLSQPYQYAQLDASDVSLYDFPAWVLTSSTAASPTSLHARGRLPDIGLCSGLTGSSPASCRPCAIGTTIRDGSNNIVYVTLNQMIVPYNDLLS
jgi:hypothetical protein